MANPPEGQFSDPVDVNGSIPNPLPVTITPGANRSAITFTTVTVNPAGTPVPGPNLVVPSGYSLMVRLRETLVGTPIGYVANSGANCAISANRNEVLKGSGFVLWITNANLLYFDSDTNGTIFELTVEQ